MYRDKDDHIGSHMQTQSKRDTIVISHQYNRTNTTTIQTEENRGVDPYGTGGHVPPIFGLGDIITNVPLNTSGVISATFYPLIFS